MTKIKKNNMKRLAVLTVVFCAIALTGFSQKIAFVDAQTVMFLMPEYKTAAAKVDSLSRTKQEVLKKLETEYTILADSFQKVFQTLDQTEKDDFLYQLEMKQGRYQNYLQNTETLLAKEQQEALKPISEKVQATIKSIAEEKGYTYVLSAATALYTSDESADITELVLNKLGLKMPSGPPAAANGGN